MALDYIAIAREGDIPGMTNPGEPPATFPVTTNEELKMWRDFNRANKDYLEHCDLSVRAGCKGPRRLFDKARTAFYDAYEALQQYYGENVFSKWHGRTTWVCKPNKRDR
jgi:hypothetical protein